MNGTRSFDWRKRRRGGRAGAGLLLALVTMLVACGIEGPEPKDPDAPLPVEDVGVPPDSLVDIEDDLKGRAPAAASLSGLLPSDFPESIPVPQPASVTDLGDGAEGPRFVELLVSAPPSSVRQGWAGRLRAAGWFLEPGSADDLLRYRRQGAAIAVRIEPAAGNTKLRIEY